MIDLSQETHEVPEWSEQPLSYIHPWKVKWILMKPSTSAAKGLSWCQMRSKGYFSSSINFNGLQIKAGGLQHAC